MYSRRTLLAMPALAGMSPVKAASPIGARMQQMIDKRGIPGAVTMVARRDGIAHLEATGHADPEAKKPLKKDAIFWIASMTKPVTGAAVMMMLEEGKLSVEDPVSKFIPELGNLKMADGKLARVTLRHMFDAHVRN